MPYNSPRMDEPDVFDGAMRIARVEYPDIDPAFYLTQLDEFAAGAREEISGLSRAGVDEFNEVFFGRLGFHGNMDEYYDPRNSYLNEVIDRRTGIPITLAAVWCEVARRAGFETEGVGFPGHFLARVLLPAGDEVLVDCFHARCVTREQCGELLAQLNPEGGVALNDGMFGTAGPRDILARMLNNLRRIHAGLGEFARAIRWIDLGLELNPGAPEDYRERGILWTRLEEFGRALPDLERYLRLAPRAPDADDIRGQMVLLRKLLSRLN